jgi:hypothetical protein
MIAALYVETDGCYTSLPAFSCARRANDSSNEFAACLQHCGDDKRCIRTLSDAERIEAQELRELTLTIRRWLNTPADSWFHRAAEAVMAIHPQYDTRTPSKEPTP